MIKSLRIENYAIIDKVEITFDKGLNIITGETGAGKSILLGALGLIMGQRADTTVLYNEEKKCIVEAQFSEYPQSINQLLEENDFDQEESLIIRREIVPGGKSRAFVNDTPAKLNFLQKLNAELVDLNEQFEITQIRQSDYQLEIIDAIAKNGQLLSEYRDSYRKFINTKRQLKELESATAAQIREMEFIKFQLDELVEAGLEPGEQEILESEQELLSRVDDINLLLEESKYVLRESEENIQDRFRELSRKWEDFSESHLKFEEGREKMDHILETIDEIYEAALEIQNSVDSDPGRLQEIESRLNIIYNLQKKHDARSIDELIEIRDSFEISLENYMDRDAAMSRLTKELEALNKELTEKASALSKKRAEVFPRLENNVNERLGQLAMESAEIRVHRADAVEFGPAGKDNINIEFKSNKGGKFLPIRNIASGGESSRLMLSIKSMAAGAMELPTMIFDEIDTGVSGEVAARMGDILKSLSAEHQLICITHSPQVSARANNHYLVYKQEGKDRTYTHVKLLQKDDRITEIAKMLSGDPPSAFALDNARDLMNKTQ